ncbi:ABC transporter ATP-binding protein [candidate division WOR-3 bacterium]|nr:ABC transporter ATP-binding protein [candidate division WOR-3 bacterium]
MSFSYGRVAALDGVTLKLEKGIYGLLGPNGAGKTTLMKIILGFLNPKKGTARVLGQDIKNNAKILKRKIGYMPESECLLPEVDGITLVEYLGELSGMPRVESMKRAHEVLFYAGLEEQRYRRVQTYSTGMKQKIKLAQAIVHDPELLFLDEPTAGLDPRGRKEMLDLINDISKNHDMSIILSTHILPDIEYTCGKAVIIDKGKIISVEPTIAMAEKSRDAVEIKVDGDETVYCRILEEKGLKFERTENKCLKVMVPSDFDKKNFFRYAIEAKTGIVRYSRIKSSLSDRFIRAVGKQEQ